MSGLQPGIKGQEHMEVKKGNTAMDVGSGSVPVFATPFLVALMEAAAINAVKDYLPQEMSTVGGRIECKHLSPTPIGMTVTAVAELIEVDKKRLSFKIEAFDEQEKIGESEHDRFLIEEEKFMQHCEQKKKKGEQDKKN